MLSPVGNRRKNDLKQKISKQDGVGMVPVDGNGTN